MFYFNCSGIIGCVLLSYCALPQVIKTWKTKSVGDLSFYFLLVWFLGDLLMGIYILSDIKWPLVINYFLNGFFSGYLLFAKWKYKGKNNE